MAAQSSIQAQFSYETSTPPPPPPKPTNHSSGRGTPASGPPSGPASQYSHADFQATSDAAPQAQAVPQTYINVPLVEPGWLPATVKDQNVADLTSLLQNPSLQTALLNSPSTTHPSIPQSNERLSALLASNLQIATQLTQLEQHLRSHRESTQSSLLSLRALERQWKTKQSEQDAALRDFSAPALYQRLLAAVGEGEETCRAMEESFLRGMGNGDKMGEREIQDFVRRYRDARKVAFLRRERKERWDEGRVGGWR